MKRYPPAWNSSTAAIYSFLHNAWRPRSEALGVLKIQFAPSDGLLQIRCAPLWGTRGWACEAIWTSIPAPCPDAAVTPTFRDSAGGLILLNRKAPQCL